jgi:hypothetical protein
MAKRIIDEKELEDLICDANRYRALESGGVDNWEWCGASMSDYLDACADELHIPEDEDFGFRTLAQIELVRYKTYYEKDMD